MTSEGLLALILGITLFIFLVLSILVIFHVLKVVKSVQRIADQAETATENVVKVSEMVKKSVTPVMVSKVVARVAQKIVNSKKGKK